MILLPINEKCSKCGRYANRGVSVDAIIIKDNRILLVQRGREPYKGYWGTPGGFVGWNESAGQAVKREVKEETNLEVIDTKFVLVNSNPKRHPEQVINLVYLVKVADGELKHGDDVVDACWFPLYQLPEPLALDHKENIEAAIKFFKIL